MARTTQPFTKLFHSIVTSSIWNENDKTRVVWITLLALSDKDGFVGASVGGLAHAARVSKEDCQVALECLMSPDDDSRDPAFAGQRVEKSEGGFTILNYRKKWELGRQLDRTEYLRIKKQEERERKRCQQMSTNDDTPSTSLSPSISVSNDAAWLQELQQDARYKGLDVQQEHHNAVVWYGKKGKSLTRRRFLKWLDGADKPMKVSKPTTRKSGEALWM